MKHCLKKKMKPATVLYFMHVSAARSTAAVNSMFEAETIQRHDSGHTKTSKLEKQTAFRRANECTRHEFGYAYQHRMLYAAKCSSLTGIKQSLKY